MPTQPNEVGRDLERRASDGLNPEKRTETAGHPATRRKVLSMVTGGIAATAAVGTATASKRPTVTATSPECGVLHLQYTDRGPTVQVNIDGPQSESVTLGKSNRSESLEVAPGDYFVEARPVNANGGSSVPVKGPPVDVLPCSVPSIEATLVSCLDFIDMGEIELFNPLDGCVTVDVEYWSSGDQVNNTPFTIEPGKTAYPGLDFARYDKWVFRAYSPSTAGDCPDSSGSTIQINDEPSPLELTGTSCSEVEKDL